MWTDNGAFFHANSWANDNETRVCVDAATGQRETRCLETILPAVKAMLTAQHVPVRQLQLDSWYYVGEVASGHVYCVRNWTAAKRSLFPSGTIERVVAAMNISSTVLYLPFFCEENVYTDRFRFIKGSSVVDINGRRSVPSTANCNINAKDSLNFLLKMQR